MIIRKGATSAEVQNQVKSVSQVQRGFNQTTGHMRMKMNTTQTSETRSSMLSESIDLRKKLSSLKNNPKINK